MKFDSEEKSVNKKSKIKDKMEGGGGESNQETLLNQVKNVLFFTHFFHHKVKHEKRICCR